MKALAVAALSLAALVNSYCSNAPAADPWRVTCWETPYGRLKGVQKTALCNDPEVCGDVYNTEIAVLAVPQGIGEPYNVGMLPRGQVIFQDSQGRWSADVKQSCAGKSAYAWECAADLAFQSAECGELFTPNPRE